MKDIITGVTLIFTCCSSIQFWYWFRHLEKTKQIELKDNIFGGKNG